MQQPASPRTNQNRTIWISTPYPMVAVGLAQILRQTMRVYTQKDPGGALAAVIIAVDDAKAVTEEVGRVRRSHPEAPVLLFDTRIELPLARAALQAGARGFIHAGMTPQQILRAVEVATSGELSVPRKVLEDLVTGEGSADLGALSHRQREILGLVAEGRSNAQIAAELYLSESTVKQHLRAAYKTLGVRNRGEAARLVNANN